MSNSQRVLGYNSRLAALAVAGPRTWLPETPLPHVPGARWSERLCSRRLHHPGDKRPTACRQHLSWCLVMAVVVSDGCWKEFLCFWWRRLCLRLQLEFHQTNQMMVIMTQREKERERERSRSKICGAGDEYNLSDFFVSGTCVHISKRRTTLPTGVCGMPNTPVGTGSLSDVFTFFGLQTLLWKHHSACCWSYPKLRQHCLFTSKSLLSVSRPIFLFRNSQLIPSSTKHCVFTSECNLCASRPNFSIPWFSTCIPNCKKKSSHR